MLPSIWMPRRPSWGRIGLGGGGGALPPQSSLTHGASYTITGTGFGTKATAAPKVWETLDDTSLVSGLTGASMTLDSTANLRHARVSHSARVNFNGTSLPGYFAYSQASGAAQWFFQYWIYLPAGFEWGTSSESPTPPRCNIKFLRLHPAGYPAEGCLWSNGGYAYNGWEAGNTAFRFVETNGGVTGVFAMASVFGLGAWHCVQGEWGENTGAGNADGRLRLWVDGALKDTSDTFITNTSSDGAAKNKNPLLLGWYDSAASFPGGTAMYVDYSEVYVDTTFARVELGDSATYGSCTHREVQPITAWSDTSITVTVNLGSFETGATVYPHVTHADGTQQVLDPLTVG